MEYTNERVRRKDRFLEKENAYALLENGEYGILSIQSETGKGAYGIPVNFVWDGKDSIYIHCAPEGRKLECLRRYPETSFCVVGHTQVISRQFTTEYESIIAQCTASLGLSPEERMHALKLILQKYSPNDGIVGHKYAEKSFHRTEIIRLHIANLSGKCKRVL